MVFSDTYLSITQYLYHAISPNISHPQDLHVFGNFEISAPKCVIGKFRTGNCQLNSPKFLKVGNVYYCTRNGIFGDIWKSRVNFENYRNSIPQAIIRECALCRMYTSNNAFQQLFLSIKHFLENSDTILIINVSRWTIELYSTW